MPAVLIAAAVGGGLAAVVGLALTRMQEGAMAMATIGVLVIFFVVFDNWDEVTRGATGVFGIPQLDDRLLGPRLRRPRSRRLPGPSESRTPG